MSSQLVNFHKFLVQFLNNIQGTMKRGLETLNITIFNGISKYLGCPLIQGRVKRKTFLEVIIKSKKS